jgi:hypothetical protein
MAEERRPWLLARISEVEDINAVVRLSTDFIMFVGCETPT